MVNVSSNPKLMRNGSKLDSVAANIWVRLKIGYPKNCSTRLLLSENTVYNSLPQKMRSPACNCICWARLRLLHAKKPPVNFGDPDDLGWFWLVKLQAWLAKLQVRTAGRYRWQQKKNSSMQRIQQQFDTCFSLSALTSWSAALESYWNNNQSGSRKLHTLSFHVLSQLGKIRFWVWLSPPHQPLCCLQNRHQESFIMEEYGCARNSSFVTNLVAHACKYWLGMW